ncbi:hypothetical protein [Salmonella phage SD-6_S16]|nr:hypothetical protein [Salmonella phage SD-6_S16]WPK20851.1 hypothetical protein [Salmonella phage SD-15_S21]
MPVLDNAVNTFFYYSVLKTIFKKYLQTMFKGV